MLDIASLVSDEVSEEQRAREERCGVKVTTMLRICSVVQALPICLARGSIRRRASSGEHRIEERFAVHHLIPIIFATHDILWRVNGRWDQNDPAINGLALPTSRSRSFAAKLPYHAGPHPQYSHSIEVGLDRLARFRNSVGWTTDQLLPVFVQLVSQIRQAVLALPPGSSVNECRINYTFDEAGLRGCATEVPKRLDAQPSLDA